MDSGLMGCHQSIINSRYKNEMQTNPESLIDLHTICYVGWTTRRQTPKHIFYISLCLSLFTLQPYLCFSFIGNEYYARGLINIKHKKKKKKMKKTVCIQNLATFESILFQFSFACICLALYARQTQTHDEHRTNIQRGWRQYENY